MSETKGKSTGRPCSICTHKRVKEVNAAIVRRDSFRNIAERYDLALGSISRHTENCLGMSLAVAIEEGRIQQAIDVHAEFAEQLAFAKQLREASREYLASEADPLRIVLIPRADEVEIAYFDFADRADEGKPKKKTANLHALLAKIEGGLNIEADKITIKHVDIRKFALDAINTTDACIDKFAKLTGAYQKEGQNQNDLDRVAKAYRKFLDDFPQATDQERDKFLDMFATEAGVSAATIRKQMQIQELGGVQ